jgi:poly(3-hydroxybutyrate) depolymerase
VLVNACQVPNPSGSARLPFPTTVATVQMVKNANNVTYGTSASQSLDVYRPARPNRAVLLWVHGGGWADADSDPSSLASEEPSGFQPIVPGLYQRGWTVLSLRYRGSDEAPFPAPLTDVKTAIRWIKAHAAELGVDADSIVVAGFSAGGHLAALAGTAQNYAEPTGLPANLRAVTSRPAAVIAIDAVLDPATFPLAGGLGNSNAAAVNSLLGCTGSTSQWQRCRPELLAATRVTRYADPADPAMYIVAGDRDGIVNPEYQALQPVAALTRTMGDTRVWFDLIDTGSAAAYGGADPRNHTLAASYEINFAALQQFLAQQVPALGTA